MLGTLQGTLVNGAAIILGALVGILAGKVIPKRLSELTVQIVGLCTLLIGLQLALNSRQVILLIISLVLGGIIGELIALEERLSALGAWLESRLGNGTKIARAFVFATLLYGVGAMAITGALESGLLGKHQILYSKSILDGLISIVLGSTMGFGVALSAIPVMIYQGGLALAAQAMSSLLTETVITELSATGGLLIVVIGLNLLKIKEIKVGNLLPALLLNLLLVSWRT